MSGPVSGPDGSGARAPNSFLRGAPSHRIRDHARYVPDHDESVKLECGNGREHFARTAELTRHDGDDLRVFSWTHRTYIAE